MIFQKVSGERRRTISTHHEHIKQAALTSKTMVVDTEHRMSLLDEHRGALSEAMRADGAGDLGVILQASDRVAGSIAAAIRDRSVGVMTTDAGAIVCAVDREPLACLLVNGFPEIAKTIRTESPPDGYLPCVVIGGGRVTFAWFVPDPPSEDAAAAAASAAMGPSLEGQTVHEVAVRTLRSDREFFQKHRRERWRMRDWVPGEQFALDLRRSPVSRPHAVISFPVHGSSLILSAIIDAPDPEDRGDPWCAAGPSVARLSAVLDRIHRTVSRHTTDRELADQLLEALQSVTDATADFLATRRPMRILRDIAEGEAAYWDRIPVQGSPEPTGTYYDDRLAMLAHLTLDVSPGDMERVANAIRRGAITHACRRWIANHRPLYRPSARFMELALNPDLLLDDAEPVLLPFDTFAVDVGAMRERFVFAGEATTHVIVQYVLVDDDARDEASGAVRTGDDLLQALQVLRARCKTPAVRVMGFTRSGRVWTGPVKGHAALGSWSTWRARALAADVNEQAALFLASGLAYALSHAAVRRQAHPAERRPAPTSSRDASPEQDVQRIRCFDVDHTSDVLRPPSEPLVRESKSGPSREQLLLTLTSRRAYECRPRVGPGRSARALEPVLVPARDVRRWMSLRTVLERRSGASSAVRVAPEWAPLAPRTVPSSDG